MPRVGEVCVRIEVRVSVTRNESPGCRRDRSRTGLEFAVRDLPEGCWGKKFYRRFDGKTLTLSTTRGEGFSRTGVTVKEGYTKMTVEEGTSGGLERQPPTRCRGMLRMSRGGVVVEVRPREVVEEQEKERLPCRR